MRIVSRLRWFPIAAIVALLLGLSSTALLAGSGRGECSMPCCRVVTEEATCCSSSGSQAAISSRDGGCDCAIAPASGRESVPAVVASSGAAGWAVAMDRAPVVLAVVSSDSGEAAAVPGLFGPPVAGVRGIPRGRAPPFS